MGKGSNQKVDTLFNSDKPSYVGADRTFPQLSKLFGPGEAAPTKDQLNPNSTLPPAQPVKPRTPSPQPASIDSFASPSVLPEGVDGIASANPSASGLRFVLEQLEGSELTPEHDPKGYLAGYSRFGIGVGNSAGVDPANLTVDEAEAAFMKNYADDTFQSLQDEKDKAAYANLLLHRPAWAAEFNKSYQGALGGSDWRNALLDYQEGKYSSKPSEYQKAWLNRVAKTRGFTS